MSVEKERLGIEKPGMRAYLKMVVLILVININMQFTRLAVESSPIEFLAQASAWAQWFFVLMGWIICATLFYGWVWNPDFSLRKPTILVPYIVLTIIESLPTALFLDMVLTGYMWPIWRYVVVGLVMLFWTGVRYGATFWAAKPWQKAYENLRAWQNAKEV